MSTEHKNTAIIDYTKYNKYSNTFEDYVTNFYINDDEVYPMAKFCEITFNALTNIPIRDNHITIIIRIPYMYDLPEDYFKSCLRQIVKEIMSRGKDSKTWSILSWNRLRFFLDEQHKDVSVDIIAKNSPVDVFKMYQTKKNTESALNIYNTWIDFLLFSATHSCEPISREIIDLLKDCKY